MLLPCFGLVTCSFPSYTHLSLSHFFFWQPGARYSIAILPQKRKRGCFLHNFFKGRGSKGGKEQKISKGASWNLLLARSDLVMFFSLSKSDILPYSLTNEPFKDFHRKRKTGEKANSVFWSHRIGENTVAFWTSFSALGIYLLDLPYASES